MTGNRPVQEQEPGAQPGPSIVKMQIKGIKIRFLLSCITAPI